MKEVLGDTEAEIPGKPHVSEQPEKRRELIFPVLKKDMKLRKTEKKTLRAPKKI